MSPKKWMMVAGFGLAWVVLFLALMLIFGLDNKPDTAPVFGSLEGRFESKITMDLDGKTLHYRENEVTNYLMIGVDNTDVTRTTGHQNGGQADFLLVLSVDRIRRTITPVMLDRDTMVPMQTYGVFGHPAGEKVLQLCLAQAYSGVNMPGSVNTVETVERLLQGIDIHHYVVLDMAAIPLVNDALGGVEVTLQDDFSAFDPVMVKGATLRLMGKQAEFFVRGRMTVADGTNASRMTRQQQYLSGLLTQFRATVKGNQSKLNQVLDSLKGHMATDASDNKLLHDVNAYDDYTWQPLRTLEGRHGLDEFGFAEFWADEPALKRLVADVWFQ